jgi:hypothetical protein
MNRNLMDLIKMPTKGLFVWAPTSHLFNFLQSVITTWRTRKTMRWERHWHYPVIMHSTSYSKYATFKAFLQNVKLQHDDRPDIFLSFQTDSDCGPLELGMCNTVRRHITSIHTKSACITVCNSTITNMVTWDTIICLTALEPRTVNHELRYI